jgi:hypothetical protein
MYYRYLQEENRCIIIEKSNEPLTGDNVATSNEDFNLELYDVLVGHMVHSQIIRVTLKPKSVEILTKKIKDLSDLINPTIDLNTCSLDEIKEWQINLSKKNLENYFNTHTITSTCNDPNGKQYSISREKQSLLSQMIIVTQMAKQSGIEYHPSWNATGEPCTYDWTLEQLQQLAFEIEGVVRPMVSHQQTIEAEIRACESKEEVMTVNIEIGGE